MHELQQKFEIQIAVIIMILTGGIFLFDISTPKGVAAGGLYIAVILLALKLRGAQSILLLAIVCSLLTVLGYFLKPPGGIH